MPTGGGIVPNFPTESARILLARLGIDCPISSTAHAAFADEVIRQLGWRRPMLHATTNEWSAAIYPDRSPT